MKAGMGKPQSSLSHLIRALEKEYPKISLEPSNEFMWDAKESIVYYNPSATHSSWLLLHEVGHMVSGHYDYISDMGLLKIEAEAWAIAKDIAKNHMITIDEDYIQDCMDSYRDWVHKRSTCPVCRQNGIESNTGEYQCINCLHKWEVTTNRFCRVYRKNKDPGNNRDLKA